MFVSADYEATGGYSWGLVIYESRRMLSTSLTCIAAPDDGDSWTLQWKSDTPNISPQIAAVQVCNNAQTVILYQGATFFLLQSKCLLMALILSLTLQSD